MNQSTAMLVREQMGTIPKARFVNARNSKTEWTPQYAAAVAERMHSKLYAAQMLAEFGFPLTVALAVLTGRAVDIWL